MLSDSSYFAVILMTIIQNKYYFPSVVLEFSVRMSISYNFDQNQIFIYFQISKAFLTFCINFFCKSELAGVLNAYFDILTSFGKLFLSIALQVIIILFNYISLFRFLYLMCFLHCTKKGKKQK